MSQPASSGCSAIGEVPQRGHETGWEGLLSLWGSAWRTVAAPGFGPPTG
jgi:hypothetical protein